MRKRFYLIAQGPGMYGVNVREITPEQAEAVKAMPSVKYDGVSGSQCHFMAIDGTNVIMVESDEDAEAAPSFGFDTGWWDEGEAAIKAVLGGGAE